MHVESSRIARVRAFELTSWALFRLAIASALALYVIVVSGAAVRLTSSGLGCESWPGCETGSFFPASSHHAFVEFGNRLVALLPITLTLLTWLGTRRTPGLPGWVGWVALATFLGTIGQAPLGLITIVSDLHPVLVMAHFLLALVVLAGGLVAAVEAWRLHSGSAALVVEPWLRRAALVLVAACLALVVTGAFATAAGPHPGGVDIRRLGNLTEAVYVHVRATAVFGLVFLALLGYLIVRRERSPRLLALALGLLGLILVQMAVGEIQWRSQLPWGIVLVHVSLAAAVWGATVLLAAVLWRPPAVFDSAAKRPVRASGPVEGVPGNREVPPARRAVVR